MVVQQPPPDAQAPTVIDRFAAGVAIAGGLMFVISAIAKDAPISQTYRGVLPFIATDIVRLALVAAFPRLTLSRLSLASQRMPA